MKKQLAMAFLLPLVALNLTACTSNDDVAKLEKRIQVLELTNAQLTKQLEEKHSASASINSVTSATVTDGGFNDIAGAFGENEIKDLQKLGVFKDAGTEFLPNKPITRAEFVCWLVRANNGMRPSSEKIRLAENGVNSSFTDLTSAQPYFSYIEGMNSAGWSVGYPDKTFKPEKALTREEMIAIKNPIDHGNGQYEGYEKNWADGNQISENFKKYMSDEAFGDKNWSRVFGQTKNCEPQKTVTRAEAAVCVWQIGWHHKYQANKPEA